MAKSAHDLAEEVLKAKSEHVLHSLVDLQEAGYDSHYKPRDPLSGVLPATRHLCSRRYQDYKAKSGLACCVAAIGGLRALRARAWNEDHLEQFLDDGTKYFQESLDERGGDLRKLILPELNEKMTLDGKDYTVKLVKGVAVWGRLGSADPLVFDLTRGLENFFKETDAGILQIPGFYEVAIWQEDGKYYMFDPWPADPTGRRVGLREGGYAYAAYFLRLDRLADHFLNNLPSVKRRCEYSISEVRVESSKQVAETVGEFKGVSSNRWIVNGRFHGDDARFPEENRNRQATPSAIAAIATANVADPDNWTEDQVVFYIGKLVPVILTAALYLFVVRPALAYLLESGMPAELQLYSNLHEYNKAWKNMQSLLKCCGGVRDYKDWNVSIPFSCYKEDYPLEACQHCQQNTDPTTLYVVEGYLGALLHKCDVAAVLAIVFGIIYTVLRWTPYS